MPESITDKEALCDLLAGEIIEQIYDRHPAPVYLDHQTMVDQLMGVSDVDLIDHLHFYGVWDDPEFRELIKQEDGMSYIIRATLWEHNSDGWCELFDQTWGDPLGAELGYCFGGLLEAIENYGAETPGLVCRTDDLGQGKLSELPDVVDCESYYITGPRHVVAFSVYEISKTESFKTQQFDQFIDAEVQ